MIRNKFFEELNDLYLQNASTDDLKRKLGRGRAKKGMFEGDLLDGELEIGQAASQLDLILPANEIVEKIITEFESAKSKLF